MSSESKIIFAKWCNVCNAAPAEGILWVSFDDEDGDYPLDACKACAVKELGDTLTQSAPAGTIAPKG